MAEASTVKEMAEAWLCLMTEQKIFGINLSNLSKSEADWTCLPTPNFDFSLDLPTRDLCPFVFDSKICMASESLDPNWGYDEESDFPPNQIYEFKIGSKKKRKHQQQLPDETLQPRISLSESFPPAPVPFLRSYLTIISGDVYVYVDPSQEADRPESIHVLCSSSKEWKPLPPLPPPPPPPPPPSPPGEGEIDNVGASGMFVLHDKLFLASFVSSNYLVSLNPKGPSWEVEHKDEPNNVTFFCHPGNPNVPGTDCICLPYLSVVLEGPRGGSYDVALSFSFHPCIVKSGCPRKWSMNLYAFLVNQKGGVISYQLLDQCFEGIQPTMEALDRIRFGLVDLGNSKLCAVLFTSATEIRDLPVLCISVFTLSAVKDLAALHTRSGAPPSSMEQTFLSVIVHSKNVYNMKDWYPYDNMKHTFVWPPLKGGRFQQRTAFI